MTDAGKYSLLAENKNGSDHVDLDLIVIDEVPVCDCDMFLNGEIYEIILLIQCLWCQGVLIVGATTDTDQKHRRRRWSGWAMLDLRLATMIRCKQFSCVLI